MRQGGTIAGFMQIENFFHMPEFEIEAERFADGANNSPLYREFKLRDRVATQAAAILGLVPDLGQQTGDLVRPVLFFGTCDFRRLGQRLANARIYLLLQTWQDFVAKAIARVPKLAIGGVFTPG